MQRRQSRITLVCLFVLRRHSPQEPSLRVIDDGNVAVDDDYEDGDGDDDHDRGVYVHDGEEDGGCDCEHAAPVLSSCQLKQKR